MKTITKKIMTLSILSVIALSAMTTTVSAQNNSINVNDVTETNTVVEYNPLGYDWEEFFSCNNNSYVSYAPYTI